jgi:hypothetical protein
MAEGRARRVAALAAELTALSETDLAALERAVGILEKLPGRRP